MESFITVMTFNHPAELAVLRTLLEANEIEYRLLDELTVQTHPFYSNAIGGVKLQVRESHVQKAIEILKDGGFINDEDLQPPKSQNKLKNATSRIPLLKNLRPELRIMIIIFIVVVILVSITYYATSPSTYEQLTEQGWCLGQIVYNGKAYKPNTVEQFLFIVTGSCQECIYLETNGSIILPGINSRTVRGKWVLKNNSLQISQTDTLGFVYNGFYKINLAGYKLTLKSKQTTLYCYPNQMTLPF